MENRGGVSRREFLKKGLASAFYLSLPHGFEETTSEERLKQLRPDWGYFNPGEKAFAVAKRQIEGLYTSMDLEKPDIKNKIVRDYSDRPYIPLYPVRKEVNRGTCLWIKINEMNPEFLVVLPQNGVYIPFEANNSDSLLNSPLYVRKEDFDPVMPLPKISVLPDTGFLDKDIVVIRTPAPELMLIEGDTIVMRVPAILGSLSKQELHTPLGRLPVSGIFLSRHMPEQFIGVPNCLLVSPEKGIYIHGAPYYDWEKIRDMRRKGGYWYYSSGCINMADEKYGMPSVDGVSISISLFNVEWALTNYSYYDVKTMEGVQILSSQREAMARRILVHSVRSIDDLKYSQRLNPKRNFDAVIKTYKAFEDEFNPILPNI